MERKILEFEKKGIQENSTDHIFSTNSEEVQLRIEGWIWETDNLWKIIRIRKHKLFGYMSIDNQVHWPKTSCREVLSS